jgi:hypothetical protein
MDKNELADRYKKAVEGMLGLVATIDKDGDVVFHHPDRGGYFFNLNAERDPEYLMLIYPYFMDKSDVGGDGDALVRIANEVNRTVKVAKIVVMDNEDCDVMAGVECLVAGPDEAPTQEFLNSIIRRAYDQLSSAVESFTEIVAKRSQMSSVS